MWPFLHVSITRVRMKGDCSRGLADHLCGHFLRRGAIIYTSLLITHVHSSVFKIQDGPQFIVSSYGYEKNC